MAKETEKDDTERQNENLCGISMIKRRDGLNLRMRQVSSADGK